MSAEEFSRPRSPGSQVEGLLTWLGGGFGRELAERHERSNHAVVGAVVAIGALLACVVAGVAVGTATRWPIWAVAALALTFGLLVGAVMRATVSGPARRRPGIVDTAGRAAVAVAIGVVVGDLAALTLLSGSIAHHLDERALRDADTAPAVLQASTSLEQARSARVALDYAVDQARGHLDNALVVARCEYHPTASCPQTRITGDPGTGPETRTANELLADAQHELDNAVAARDRQRPDLDVAITGEQRTLTQARQAAVADTGRGVGARWIAMNDLTRTNAGALALRLLTIAFFALLYLLPLFLRRWRGESTQERQTAVRADRERAGLQRERADLEADTAIAVKRAEIRRTAEILWAEHQLTQTRLAIAAQEEIDRERQRRRVVEALEAPAHVAAHRPAGPAHEDMYLPIAAQAEAASLAATALPAGPEPDAREETLNLPATAESGDVVERPHERSTGRIPSIPDAAIGAAQEASKAAARWIRPLVPPFVARAIDNTTAPLRSARHVIEEFEEVAFSFRRTRTVTMASESSDAAGQAAPGGAAPTSGADDRSRVASSRGHAAHGRGDALGAEVRRSPQRRMAGSDGDLALEPTERGGREQSGPEGPPELSSSEGPRQLPPGR